MSTKTPEETAAEIAALGLRDDDPISLLAKGITQGMGHLAELAAKALDLAKGKGGDADDDEGDDEGGDDEGGDDAPGYQDMNLGSPAGAGALNPAQGRQVDVTTLIMGIPARLTAMEKANARLERQLGAMAKQNQKLMAQNAVLAELVTGAAKASAEMIAPLAKAVAVSHAALLDVPARGITPDALRLRPAHRPEDAAPLGGKDDRLEKQILAKASRLGKLDFEQIQTFRRSRKFAEDPVANAAIRAEVEALAATI